MYLALISSSGRGVGCVEFSRFGKGDFDFIVCTVISILGPIDPTPSIRFLAPVTQHVRLQDSGLAVRDSGG